MKFDPSTVRTSVPSPLGNILIAATARGLTGLWFTENQRYLPSERAGNSAWPEDPEHPVLRQAGEQLDEYFAGQRSHFDLPLDL
ncbi:MAG: cysteine methyltransferase, partial [Polaromonas sp.]